jgi:hypothetical protein
MVRAVLLATTGLLAVIVALASCGGDDSDEAPVRADASVDRVGAAPDVLLADVVTAPDAGGTDATLPEAACPVAAETHPLEPGAHVPEGTILDASTNPPSSGPHYGIWANFREYDKVIADGYLLHSMEHGAVVLFYDCDPSACVAAPGVLEALRAVRDAVPTDPLCDPSIRVRVIIAPRPANDVPVAAAAWGATYKADCVDAPSLGKFITDFYAKAPENFCAPGSNF